ncbi:MAG TPA: cupin domain-containing protein [Candidatus Binataceae bacterium]|nr:cupin domain-containing protein [Candidatus Binataceae bacterium]
MPFIDTSKLDVVERLAGWRGRAFNSENMTFAHYEFDAGASIHEHCHSNEEVWNVIEGQMEVTIGGVSRVAGPGAVAVVPPNTAHSVRAVTNGKAIVVDQPTRRDMPGRAALGIEFETPITINDNTHPITIAFAISNRGQTPAALKRVTIESAIAQSLPSPISTQIPAGELSTIEELKAGGIHRATIEHCAITDQQRSDLVGGASVFYVNGVIVYEDSAGQRHHSTFCRIYDRDALGGKGGLVLPGKPGYNYGD